MCLRILSGELKEFDDISMTERAALSAGEIGRIANQRLKSSIIANAA